MTVHTFWKFSALALTLIAPAAMADWRSDGNLKRNKVSSSDDDRDTSSDSASDSAQNDEEDAETARAEKEARGFSLGLRAGFGLPYGKAIGGTDTALGDTISGVIPLQLDAGYFLTSHLYLGGSFQYAPALLAEDCPEEASCSASVMRFGVNVAYHFSPLQKIDPWLGLGVGYEILKTGTSVSGSGQTFELNTTGSGLEFAAFQGGVDFRINKALVVGPFLTFTVGQYLSSSISSGGETRSDDIEEKAIHGWLMGGVRAQVRF
ncbi:hypothetical protein [Stigmatella aurantiaca]|uniref:Conserved uncharacterized protein n=1 Tax=Stigmatella aurantiaca (strain DW4/3-1) TaxID=378806 RepID=Q090T5_STIAD|nr:hypothetical protein [Stigmatella aurantiaca]ADO75666.1 conserved uncharacterized protein [Stigmatella aurantiaca DW4/3-1]EAU66245.1 hypothetical protein STIAU_3847 [Stigmatella aurantiaca DW4/3-1]